MKLCADSATSLSSLGRSTQLVQKNCSAADEIILLTCRTRHRAKMRANTPNSMSSESPAESQSSKNSTIGAINPDINITTAASWSSRFMGSDYMALIVCKVHTLFIGTVVPMDAVPVLQRCSANHHFLQLGWISDTVLRPTAHRHLREPATKTPRLGLIRIHPHLRAPKKTAFDGHGSLAISASQTRHQSLKGEKDSKSAGSWRSSILDRERCALFVKSPARRHTS